MSYSLILEATITAGNIITITLTSSSPKFRRKGASSTSYYYSVTLISISKPGLYVFTSTSSIATHGFIYLDNFDPENSSANILGEDYGTTNNGQFNISVFLQQTTQVSRGVGSLTRSFRLFHAS